MEYTNQEIIDILNQIYPIIESSTKNLANVCKAVKKIIKQIKSQQKSKMTVDLGDEHTTYLQLEINKSDLKRLGRLLDQHQKSQEDYSVDTFLEYLRQKNFPFKKITPTYFMWF